MISAPALHHTTTLIETQQTAHDVLPNAVWVQQAAIVTLSSQVASLHELGGFSQSLVREEAVALGCVMVSFLKRSTDQWGLPLWPLGRLPPAEISPSASPRHPSLTPRAPPSPHPPPLLSAFAFLQGPALGPALMAAQAQAPAPDLALAFDPAVGENAAPELGLQAVSVVGQAVILPQANNIAAHRMFVDAHWMSGVAHWTLEVAHWVVAFAHWTLANVHRVVQTAHRMQQQRGWRQAAGGADCC